MTTVHLEFQVSDLKAGMAFYGDLLGWRFARMGDMDYYLISGDGIGEGQPVSGGLLPRNGPVPEAGTPPRGAMATFPVKDVDAAYARALDLGGAEAMPPTDFPGVGRVCVCEDGHGNIFGMIQPPKEMM